jgi:hypothetical protein
MANRAVEVEVAEATSRGVERARVDRNMVG